MGALWFTMKYVGETCYVINTFAKISRFRPRRFEAHTPLFLLSREPLQFLNDFYVVVSRVLNGALEARYFLMIIRYL
jgi:hypothetical protein